MYDDHIPEELLRAFFSGTLDGSMTRQVAGHLLSQCEACQALAQRLLPQFNGTDHELSNREPVLDSEVRWSDLSKRVTSYELARQRESELASELADQLLQFHLGQRLMMVRNLSRFHSWSLTEELLDRAWEARFDDVNLLVELAETAVAVASELDEARYGKGLIHDIRSRSWSYLGNGHRILRELDVAAGCFQRAREELRQGTGDPLELASVLNLEASFELELKHHEKAAELASRVAAIHGRLGDDHSVGHAKLMMAQIRARQGEMKSAIAALRESLELLDPEVDPRLVLAAKHNLVDYLQEAGELEHALAQLRETRPLYDEIGDRLSLLKLRYLEAHLAQDLGQHHLAERCYLEARNGFVSHGLAAEAAEATLELSLLYLEERRFAETRRLAEQMVPIFQCKGLHQEALAALLIFRDAAVKETVTTHLASETLKLVQKMQAGA